MLYTEQHCELMRSVGKFVEAEIDPHAEEWEQAGIFPAHELFRKMGQQGLLGIHKPEKYGGQGLDYSYEIAFCEAIGAAKSASAVMGIGVQTDMATPALMKNGSDELRDEFLKPSISGEYVACLGVSEAGAGSDVASIKTTARRDGGDYVINGGKMWTTNGTQADWMCLLANTSDGPAHRNKSLICLPMKTKGVQVARKLDKMGMRASDTAQIFFDNVRVPLRYRIGEEGFGFTYQMQQFQEERLWAAAAGLMKMERAIRMTIEYTAGRQAFGKSILDNQVVHFRLAELQTKVELQRSIVYRAVEEYINGIDVTQLASMAKLTAGRLLREVSDSCLQYWGGMGYMTESEISRMYRDGRLTSIGGGADEIMLGIICKGMGILPGQKKNPLMTDLPRFETLLLERRGRALYVTLNRPETKNAINRDMVRELTALAGLLAQDRETGAIVMRGANGTFCAGGDIKGFMTMFKSAPPKPGEKDSVALGNREFGSFMTRFEALPQAIVMVVEGSAYGGGLGLLCAGDVVLAAADAKFAMSETGLGIPPAQIAPFVAARVGIARTRRLALTGYRFDGREAERIGLVDMACTDSAALEAALTQVLAEIGRCAPGANAAIKRLLLASRTMPRDQLLDESADAFAACLRGPEGQEGVTAFLEKRKPSWVDR